MTGSVFKWVKLFVENSFVSKNKWLIILLIGGLTAGGAQEFRYWGYVPAAPVHDAQIDIKAILSKCERYTDKRITQHKRRLHP